MPSIAALVLSCWTFGACTSHPHSDGNASDGSDRSSGKSTAAAVVKPKPTLAEGGKAYLRIKEYQAKADKSAPKGAAATLAFGDAVILVAKKDGLPAFWVASKGPDAPPVLIPAYLLTPSEEEIGSLRSKDRIPQTMSFLYIGKNGLSFVYGDLRF